VASPRNWASRHRHLPADLSSIHRHEAPDGDRVLGSLPSRARIRVLRESGKSAAHHAGVELHAIDWVEPRSSTRSTRRSIQEEGRRRWLEHCPRRSVCSRFCRSAAGGRRVSQNLNGTATSPMCRTRVHSRAGITGTSLRAQFEMVRAEHWCTT
jgi:hypothetical protein